MSTTSMRFLATAVRVYNNDDIRCNGIQSTQWFTSNPFRIWNEVRRWDATTYNFFAAYGNWPRL